MKVGMLWFDNDPKVPLETKISRAAEYYERKYGTKPNACLVNPKALAEPVVTLSGVAVQAMRAILPGHLWIGVEEKN